MRNPKKNRGNVKKKLEKPCVNKVAIKRPSVHGVTQRASLPLTSSHYADNRVCISQ